MSRMPMRDNGHRGIPEATVNRLPVYLRALYALADRGIATVSSEELAAAAGVNSAKLRKDLSHLGSYGTRGVGYDVEYLVYQVSRELGLTQDWPVIIVGAGNLGHALANYGGFASRGFRIAALFDSDPQVVGTEIAYQVVRHADEIESVIARHGVSIGVIATPAASAAQAVCERLVAAGITSILNFAPVVLNVPQGVDVRKVDLSIELQILAFHAQRRAVVRVAHNGERDWRDKGWNSADGEARRRGGRGSGSTGDMPMDGEPGSSAGGGYMSVLVVGLSHKSAPVTTLERAVLTGDTLGKLLGDVFHAGDVAGSLVVSTCNRVEVYAEVDKFHGSLSAICELLARHAGLPLPELTPHLYVHYEDRAIQHLLLVACGLDSMVIGESQILGQVRAGARAAAGPGHAQPGPLRPGLARAARGQARAHRDRDRPGGRQPGQRGARRRRPAPAARRCRRPRRGLAGLSVLVVGAGAMSSLAVATAARMGAASIVVANRSAPGPAAGRDRLRHHGRPGPAAGRDRRRGPGRVLHRRARARDHRGRRGRGRRGTGRRPGRWSCSTWRCRATSTRPRPDRRRDRDRPGPVGDDQLARAARRRAHVEDVAAVRQIVAEELAAQVSADRAARVAPTVVALRAKAAEVVDAELARLIGRVGGLDARARREIAQSMRRIADKLLHAPTVRVKELAGSPGRRLLRGGAASALRPRSRRGAGRHPSGGRRPGMAGSGGAEVTPQALATAARHPQEPDGHGPVADGRAT